ncbi:MAG: homocysteine S-methyltransferase family protein [Methyloligellaceae bacterium]
MTEAKYINSLPQTTGKPFITDGGLETCLIFHEGFDLPLFASFPLMESREGRAALDRYMRRFCEIALREKKGFLMDTPTWRASKKWATDLGFSGQALASIHEKSIEYLKMLREEFETDDSPLVINGAIGPQDDGYNPNSFMTIEQAEAYHKQQVQWFKAYGADMVSAITMTYAEEAIGITRAATKAGIPVVVSFTVETDGRLPSGQSLGDAIEQVDKETAYGPVYYMINCAHPDHFSSTLEDGSEWRNRIMGLRANASRMSHEELDNAEELDDGNPQELAEQYRELKAVLPNLSVVGGCCGTDHRHVGAMSAAV